MRELLSRDGGAREQAYVAFQHRKVTGLAGQHGFVDAARDDRDEARVRPRQQGARVAPGCALQAREVGRSDARGQHVVRMLHPRGVVSGHGNANGRTQAFGRDLFTQAPERHADHHRKQRPKQEQDEGFRKDHR